MNPVQSLKEMTMGFPFEITELFKEFNWIKL